MSTIRPITSDSYNNRQRAYYNSDLQRQEQSYNHYLRLIWDEMGTDIDYTLRYNTSRPGFWLFSEPQRGVMLQINHSKFSGTVQVMKAVGDHMVLTFCQGLPSSELYSIVLSRRPDTLTYDVSVLMRARAMPAIRYIATLVSSTGHSRCAIAAETPRIGGQIRAENMQEWRDEYGIVDNSGPFCHGSGIDLE